MASLNLSTNGPSITKSYQSVVNANAPSGASASSTTYGQWAVYSVSAPLANAFQDAGNKESVLKVQSTGEGELIDLIEEFSDGRVQFAFVKVKDSNTGLPKYALIAWCGEGVPERTKGYFTSHMTAVAKLLHGYHVQITARSDRDLTPESIMKKVADSSGAKYSNAATETPTPSSNKPTLPFKPAFTPTQSSSGPVRASRKQDPNVDADGWGADAPPVTRTQLERVLPAYTPTSVNIGQYQKSKADATPSNFDTAGPPPTTEDIIRGVYQPVGRIDVDAIRKKAREAGQDVDDRPGIVKGSYEPVGKVDIAAIRAKAQKQDPTRGYVNTHRADQPRVAQDFDERLTPAQHASGMVIPAPLTSMPKPKVVNKFGSGGAFAGTKAPTPAGFEAKPASGPGLIGSAGRSFAESSGKSPAQLWAEKKARERGTSGSGSALPASGFASEAPITEQTSGNTGWESGYAGKKWGAVETNKTGRSSIPDQRTGEDPQQEQEAPSSPAGGVGTIRDRFSGAAPMGAPAQPSGIDRTPPPAPELETSTKPNRGVPIPGLPIRQKEDSSSGIPPPPAVPRSPTPETPEREQSPIRIAMPVSKAAPVQDAHEEISSPPETLPIASISRAVPEPKYEDDEPETGPDPGRYASQTTASTTLGTAATSGGSPDNDAAAGSGERARAEYDYDAQEDNEISFAEGEILTDIQRVDPDWWVVTNSKGQQGLVPANYLQLIEDEAPTKTSSVPAPAAASSNGKTAVAMYDYEAGEDNEISFPEDAVITNIEFPDEDWWSGEYKGKMGLFPASYVELRP